MHPSEQSPLQQALAITAEFRLKSYCYNGAQIEKIAICDPAIVTHFDDDKKLALTSITEKYLKIITDKNLLLKLPDYTSIFNRTYM